MNVKTTVEAKKNQKKTHWEWWLRVLPGENQRLDDTQKLHERTWEKVMKMWQQKLIIIKEQKFSSDGS